MSVYTALYVYNETLIHIMFVFQGERGSSGLPGPTGPPGIGLLGLKVSDDW